MTVPSALIGAKLLSLIIKTRECYLENKMDTRQIASILHSCPTTNSIFRGVFPLDKIKSEHGSSGIYVCNTHPSNKPGEHWIVIVISPNGGGGEYFDSFGLPPQHQEFSDFLNKNTSSSSTWLYNHERVQHPLSTVCGHYCVLYALNFARNRNMEQFIALFDKKNCFENDIIVHEYVNSAFGVNVPLIDVNMIVNQLGY